MSSKFSASHSVFEEDVTVSKSLTDLADLPIPVPKAKAVVGWNDDGFDDWNLDDVQEQKPAQKATKDKWAPPAATAKS